MHKLIQVFLKYYIVFLFVLLQLIGFSMLVRYNTYHQISYLSWLNELTGGFQHRVSNLSEHIKLAEVNEDLVAENAQLRGLLKTAYLDAGDNFFPWTDTVYFQNYQFREAKIIDNNVSAPKNYLMLNKGSLAGIQEEMGVINAHGVVGIVTDVTQHYSVVMSVLNPDLKIGVRLRSTDYFGIMTWEEMTPTHLQLNNIQSFVKIQQGDTIETMGSSGIFPEGMTVGHVDKFELENETMTWDIDVKLSADMQSAKYVYVIENLFKNEVDSLQIELNE